MNGETEPLLAEALRDPLLAKFALAGAEPVAASRSTRVIRCALRDGGAVFVKRYVYPTLGDRLRGMFRGTLFGMDKARREFENLRRMAGKGWPVPRPLEAARRTGRWFLRECTLVTAEIEGKPVRADAFLRRDPAPSWKRRGEGIVAAATLVRAMHREGYTDGSLALRNLLVRVAAGKIEVFKVDCAKGRWRN
ncbi:MAG: lipopolysaccharide kinase InaA family protein, partial [Planctomycetota bacterium]